jgi:hypothetical protein
MKQEALNNITHSTVLVDSQYKKNHGYDFNLVSVFPVEYIKLQSHYPIFFTKNKDTNSYQTVAVMGFDQNENLFLGDDGLMASYIPLSLQRLPFYIGKKSKLHDGVPVNEKILCIDIDHPSVNYETGNNIFLEHGGHSEYLDHINQVLFTIDENLDELSEFSQILSSYELFQSLELKIDFGNNEDYVFSGLSTINEDRLKGLDGKSLLKLHQKGYLQHIYMIAASIGNMNNLINFKKTKKSD